MSTLRHVKVNPKNQDVKVMPSGLNECLSVEANIDQTGMQLIHDLVYSMFDEGVVAVVPVDTTISPKLSQAYEINSMRVGKIIQWYPKHVRVRLYNEENGQNEDTVLEKRMVAIIENPLYAVMNSENSVLKRLLAKVSQLDAHDADASTGKMNMIIHIPYPVKSELQREAAEARIQEIERQLSKGSHGITYIDVAEKITQLSRPIESQLPASITELKKEFYNQLGLTENIFNGTASEAEIRIYYNRTVDPIIEHIVKEFARKFLSKTARAQGQEIQYYRDMFKFVTVEMLSGFMDTARRNSIGSSNELRKIIGWKPSDDPRADELFNPNIADKNQNPNGPAPTTPDQPATNPGSLTPPDSKSK